MLKQWRAAGTVVAPARPLRDRSFFRLGVAAAVVVALVLESFRLANSGLTFDEAATITYARLDFAHLFEALQSSDAFFGTYYAWMHLWMHIGESEAALRWFSVFCAAGAVVAMSFFARRIAGTNAGIAAGILTATSPLLFDVARQARPYALLVLVAALSSLAFLRASEKPIVQRWLPYVTIGIVGCYVHLFLLFLVAAHAIWAWKFQRTLYRSGLSWAVSLIMLSITPLLAILHHYPTVNGYIPRPTWRTLTDTWVWFAGSRELVIIAILLLVGMLAVRMVTHKRVTLTPFATFLIVTTTIPLLVVFAVSLFEKSIYLQRYLVEAWPSYIVGIAIMLTRLRPKYVAPFAVLVVVAFQAYAIRSTHLRVAQEWRAASTLIIANALPGDQLVVYPPFGMLPYDYYRQRLRALDAPVIRSPRSSPFPFTMTTNDDNKFAIDAAALEANADRSGRIWFLVGWTDDPRTAPGLRTLTNALPPSYHLSFDRRLVHEEVLRFDPSGR